MKLNNLKNFITDKWHMCQTNMAFYDENSKREKPCIKEMPKYAGLYLVYMYDFVCVNGSFSKLCSEFHYEILEFVVYPGFNLSCFKRIESNFHNKNEGKVNKNSIIKWMAYEDFLKIMEN